MMKLNIKPRAENFPSLVVFLLVCWGLLYIWLLLIHHLGERVALTLLASPLLYINLCACTFLLAVQQKSGVLQELTLIFLIIASLFISLIVIFSALRYRVPTIYDLTFYYECFLTAFFGVTPLFLFVRRF
ncbi:transporter [Kosakonia sp. HypNH10]|uniref:transporter n=1 Tax=Kosakonia sp. HypNH10 TaxID=2980101 RepID=UPI002449BFED|nr:transporter [Kosakonia sp. HypNH10]MDH2912224.1 transporter [Kosakonia sp. HypNH10]